MTRGRYSGGSSQIKGNTSIVNPGDNLQAKYDALVSNGSMGSLSETNRRYMWLTPGTYTDDLSVDTKYVHLRIMEGAVLSGAITHSNWYGTAFGTGDGSSFVNALNIDLPEALMDYCDTSADQAKYIRITANLDFTDHAEINGGAANTSTFDGGDHIIKNFVLKDNPKVKNLNGLFHANSGVIENIVMDNGTLKSSSPLAGGENKSYAAMIIAESTYGSTVRNCHVNGHISHTHTQVGSMFVGMVGGANHAEIIDCSSSGTISVSGTNGTANEGCVGGIAGYQTGGANIAEVGGVYNCRSSVTITAKTETIDIKNMYIGGLVGQSVISNTAPNTVLNSHWEGQIDFNYTNIIDNAQCKIGGIIGYIDGGPVSGCSAKGRISATPNVAGTGGSERIDIGGGVGLCAASKVISESFADIDLRLDVSGAAQQYVAGFAGRADGAVSDCYAKGSVYDLSVGSTALTFQYFGGFAGRGTSGTIDDCWCALDTYTDTGSGIAEGFIGEVAGTLVLTTCYWDSDTCGIATGASAGAYDDKTTAEMVANATFAAWSLNSGGTWKQADLVDYPKLFWEK